MSFVCLAWLWRPSFRIVIACAFAGCVPATSSSLPVAEVEIVSPKGSSEESMADPPSRAVETPITEERLFALMERRFPDQVAAGQLEIGFPDGLWPELQSELEAMGIDSMEKLEELIPPDFIEKAEIEFAQQPNVLSLTRTLLMLHDLRRYFEEAWQGHWHSMEPDDFATLRAYGIDLSPASPATEGL